MYMILNKKNIPKRIPVAKTHRDKWDKYFQVVDYEEKKYPTAEIKEH